MGARAQRPEAFLKEGMRMKKKSTFIGLGVLIAACLAGLVANYADGQPDPGERPQSGAVPAPPTFQTPSTPSARGTAEAPKAAPVNPNDGPNLIRSYDAAVRASGSPAGAASSSSSVLPAQFTTEPPAEAGPGQSNENPTGRQEPAVSLEWIGPPTIKLGQPVTFQILVRNISANPVQQVVVRNRLPDGVAVQTTEPKAATEGNVLVWNLGTLQSRQERRLDLTLLPEAKGDLTCQALVTFTGTSIARLRVREPKLLLKASGPDKILLGDVATVTLTVTNPGDGSADHVRIKAALSEGLEHIRGRAVEFDLGNLEPNESRSVQLVRR